MSILCKIVQMSTIHFINNLQEISFQSFLELDGKTVFNVKIATTLPDLRESVGLSNLDPSQQVLLTDELLFKGYVQPVKLLIFEFILLHYHLYLKCISCQ